MLISAFGAAISAFAGDQPSISIEPPNLHGPRPLQPQTAKAAIQDYLDAWGVLSNALQQNRADLLDRTFIGAAKDKLASTIKEQSASGVHTVYHDRSHKVQILFYSPEGLSLELADTVEYDVQVFDHDKSLVTERVHTKYIAVLTPTETRWRIRIFQSLAD
ncbi:MAG: hypothetical protein WBQ95_10195 [Terracidiphilus sp.]